LPQGYRRVRGQTQLRLEVSTSPTDHDLYGRGDSWLAAAMRHKSAAPVLRFAA
jgi:hypothetical protein